MKSKNFLQLIILFFALLFGRSSYALPTEAELRLWAKDKAELLLATFNEKDVEKKYSSLDELFINYVDLEYIGKFVVGKYWREMTTEQKEYYLSLFKRYSMGLYKTFPLTFDSSQIKYEITEIIKRGNEAEVSAVVKLDSKPGQTNNAIPFTLRLHETKGALQIIDIKLAESSLILSYRGKFYEMIATNDGDIVWFLEDLSDMADSIERNNQLILQNNY